FALGLQTRLSVPLAHLADSHEAYAGERNVSVLSQVLAEFRYHRARITANLGVNVRKGASFGQTLQINDELTWGLGFSVPLFEFHRLDGPRLDLHVEGYGSTGLRDFGVREQSPIEMIGGFKVRVPRGWVAGLAAGPGLQRGFGSPDVRIVGMFGLG